MKKALTAKLFMYWRAVAESSSTYWEMPEMAVALTIARIKLGLGPAPFALYKLGDLPYARWGEFILQETAMEHLYEINRQGLSLARNKVLFHEHLLANKLPAAPTIAQVGGHQIGLSLPIADSSASFQSLGLNRYSELFFKPVRGASGLGAFRASRIADVWDYCGQCGNLNDLYGFLSSLSDFSCGYLIQPVFLPHKALRMIMPNALGTVRIMTCITASGPRTCLSPVLKIPVGAQQTDNFGTGSYGNLVAAIDPDSGVLGKPWGRPKGKSLILKPVAAHPDTGAIIEGLPLPNWNELKQVVLDGQLVTPQLPTIGWDVAICQDGVKLLEANGQYGVEIIQVGHNRGMRKEFQEMLESISSRDTKIKSPRL